VTNRGNIPERLRLQIDLFGLEPCLFARHTDRETPVAGLSMSKSTRDAKAVGATAPHRPPRRRHDSRRRRTPVAEHRTLRALRFAKVKVKETDPRLRCGR